VSFLKRVFGGGRAEPREELDDRGIFAGLFVAEPAHVEAWSMEGLTPADWPAVEFKRLDSVKLGTLESILTDRDYDDIDQERELGLVRNAGDEGPWISDVRQELVDSLTTLTPELAASTAAKWADTDELKVTPTDVPRAEDIADLTTALMEMADLARRRGAGKRMYLLMGL